MPTPSFEDAPDGSSSINHTSDNPNPPISPPPHPSYEDGSAQIAPPHPNLADIYNAAVRSNPRSPWVEIVEDSWRPNLNTAIGASHVATNPNRRIEARMFSQGEVPFPMNAGDTIRRPQTATEVNDERMRAINPEWRSIPARSPDAIGAVPPNPVGYSRDFPPPCSPPRQPPRRTATEELRDALSIPRGLRRGDGRSEVVKKDPNAWSMREAVELCKLLEVVIPEAGFHIALTGGLLYKEGRRKDCDLMFYQIRQMEPNYEVLWKYLQVAGVIRSPSYPENGWLVKATYRGKAIDCLFPNAKKAKKAGTPNPDGYIVVAPNSPPTPPLDVAGFERSLAELDAERITAAARYVAALTTPSLSSTALCGPETTRAILEAAREIERESERRTGIVDPTAEARARIMAAPILVRHINGVPEFAAPPPPPPPPPPRCRICGLAVCGGCEVPF